MSAEPVVLSPESVAAIVEALAPRVAEIIRGGRLVPDGLVDAEELSRLLGVSRDFVYRHAIELGGRRIGSGPRGRLRFDLGEAERALTCSPSRESGSAGNGAVKPKPPRRRSARLGTNAPLLPIRGSREGS